MITFNITDRENGRPPEGFCLSTDTKPIEGVRNGQSLYEMDTRKLWLFDAENKRWLEQ